MVVVRVYLEAAFEADHVTGQEDLVIDVRGELEIALLRVLVTASTAVLETAVTKVLVIALTTNLETAVPTGLVAVLQVDPATAWQVYLVIVVQADLAACIACKWPLTNKNQ